MRHILFVLGTGYLPVSITGGNVSLHALCKRLIAAGFDPIVVCTPDPPEAARPENAHPITDYNVLRLTDPVAAMLEIIGRLNPEAVVVRGLSAAVRAAQFKAALEYPLRIHVLRSPAGYALPPHSATPRWRYAANSHFLVRLLEAYLGGPVDLVPSLVEPADYRCKPNGEAVLFINPIAEKGVHIAAGIAERLSHRRFLFVRSWPEHWNNPAAPVRLANVEWAASTLDMRELYARTRVLLVPSVWEESSCRAVAEAHLSGIPAVASDRGGLRESVGPGGIVMSLADPIERWCESVESLYTDQAKFERLSRLARQHVRRREIAPASVMASFYRFIGIDAAPARAAIPRRAAAKRHRGV